MSTPWQSLVARAIEGAPDDPFVRLLKRRLASGYETVRVNLTQTAKGVVYVVMVTHLRQLSTIEVPHSASFTRWSLANGVRMASREEEESRWGILAAERFQTIEDDLGADYAKLVLIERLRALGPPRAAAALTQAPAAVAAPGREKARAIRSIDAFLAGLAADLGDGLRYSAEETAQILDGALEHWGRARFQIEARESTDSAPVDTMNTAAALAGRVQAAADGAARAAAKARGGHVRHR